ncbi:MAG: ATP-binding protein [Gemmatimonadales bacterium]
MPVMTHPDGHQSSRHATIGRTPLRVIPHRSRRGPLVRYGIAAVFTLVSLALTVLLEPYLERTIFLLFWPAVIGSAWLAGFGPAMLTATASVALVDYFLLRPAGTGWNFVELVTFATFLGLAALTSWAVNIIEVARGVAADAATENARLAGLLDTQSEELTHQLEESQAMQEELEQSAEELALRTGEAETAERFTRGILESISDPFVVHDSEWRFRYVNAAAARIISGANRDPVGLIGKVVWEEWPNLEGSKIQADMRRAVETRTPLTFESFFAEQGRWAELHCYPLPDGGLGTQWKDITGRKRSEEASGYLTRATELLASSADYETTLGEVAQLIVPHFADWCAISVVDDTGHPRQLAVAHVDPEKVKWAHELNKRYPPDSNASTGVPQVIRTGEPELYPEIPDELLVAGAIDEEHLRISRELGLRSAMIVPLSTPDRTLGAITVVSAESGRRYSEADLDFIMELARRAALAVENARLHMAELEARRGAEEANEAKTQFLAVMSHELRTPLNAIGGYTELLLMGIRGALTVDQQADLERIQRSQRNLLSLINDILNYAKLEAGHVEFAIDKVPVHPVLLDIEPLITPQLRSKLLTYSYSGCDKTLTVWADAEKVRQIMLNLLSNAIKFTEPGGTISISCDSSDGHVQVIVTDTGLGIPADRLSSVFEPFVQLERNLSSNHEGTGLGLAISRDLARGMGGELSARSKVGEGSSFELRLRRVDA